MDGASAVAGLIGLAALVLQTAVQLRALCQDYASAEGDVQRILTSLQTLEGLLEEATRLINEPSIIGATTLLTRSRMTTLLNHCQKDLELWTARINHHVPKKTASTLSKKWTKVIATVDKPQLGELTTRISEYADRIDALLGVMRGDVGIYTYEAVVTSIWSQGIFQYKTKKQLKAIAHGVQALQTTQDRFKQGTYSRLDDIGGAVGAIENTLNDLWQQSSTVSKPTFKAAPDCGRALLPYVRNGDFVGRKAIVEDIEHKLNLPNSNNRCAIWGLGGIGKSQLALEVAYRAQHQFPDISCYWVSAASRTTFTQSYREIALALQIPGRDDPNKDTLDLVKTWLRGDLSSKFLMIVDNVDDMKSLKGEANDSMDAGQTDFNLLQYLPQCSQGKLLFTTRSKTAALRLTGNGAIIEIPTMDATEARDLLRVRLKDDDNPTALQDCLDLVKALEYLPLAVSQAASYIREMDDMTPALYLRRFNKGDKKRSELLTHTYEELARDEGQSNAVLTTWQISFEQIERDRPESARLLKVMGTLHWQDIPEYLLQQDDLADEDDLRDAMNPLIAFSLVKKSPDSKTFSMHRLVHIAIRSWDRKLKYEYVAQKLIVQVFPFLEINEVSAEQRQKCRQLLPHAQSILDSLGSLGKQQEESSMPSLQLRIRISLYLAVLGQYRVAREFAEPLLEPVRNLSDLGQSDISIFFLEDLITRMYLCEGNDTLALDRAQKALNERKKSLAPDNSDVIRSKDLVALSLMAQANYDEAEAELREAHEALEKSRGKRDIATIFVLISLAVAYAGNERWKQCADAYQAALDVLLPTYGDHNDCVIRCMEGLAEAERCLYRTQKAGVLIRNAVALNEEINGPDHPYTIRAIARLGNQYIDEGNPVAAFQTLKRAWKGYQRFYGDSSKMTLSLLSMVAMNHPDVEEGEKMIRVAIRQTSQLWGPGASRTMNIENNLVLLLLRSASESKEQEAAIYCRKLYETRKERFGHDNRWTLKAEMLLGKLMLANFRLNEALPLLEDTLERQLRLLGETHLDVYATEEALLLYYAGLEAEFPARERLLRKHLKFIEQQRGAHNRGVLALRSLLGHTIWLQNKRKSLPAQKALTQEGAELMIDAYETLLKLYGQEDFTTVEAAFRLAAYYMEIKEFGKAETLHRSVVEASRKRWGKDFPTTLHKEMELASCIIQSQRPQEALELIKRVLPLQRSNSHNSPDRMDLAMDLTQAGTVKALALYTLNNPQGALKAVRTECIIPLQQLPEALLATEPMQNLKVIIRSLENIFFDDVLQQETFTWAAASGQSKFKELEPFFPRMKKPDSADLSKPSKIRKRQSWCLASAENRLYHFRSAEERSADFERLRGEPGPLNEPGILTTTADAPFSCSRCENSIPVTDYFFRCFEPTCNAGTYIVCTSCHDTGLTCLDFKHLPRRVKAYERCSSCEKDITGHYLWACDICEGDPSSSNTSAKEKDRKDYNICKPCHTSGKRCKDNSHNMVKKMQPCYQILWWYGHCGCDECGNIIEAGENYSHCHICHSDDYDLCSACTERGAKCKDATHELEVKMWSED